LNKTIFRKPSDYIDLRKLERESRRILALGFIVAVIFHAIAGLIIQFRRPDTPVIGESPVYRPIPLRIITVPRRLMSPFRIMPQQPEKRRLERMRPGRRTPSGTVKTQSPSILDELGSYDPGDSIAYGMDGAPDFRYDYQRFVLDGFDFDTPVSRIPENVVSLEDELYSIDDIEAGNEGRIKGYVIFNPANRLSVTGIMYIPQIWDFSRGQPISLSPGIVQLVEAMNNYTGIIAKMDKHLSLFSRNVLKYPFLYIGCSESWDYSGIESSILGEYLESGGFVVFENLRPWEEFSPGEATLRQLIGDALGSKAQFQPIPNDHPLYHCFVDFDEGPPLGSEMQGAGISLPKPVNYLEGVWIDGRLVAIYSNKGYAMKWAARDNNYPQLRMGVNMAAYALLQAGGNAERKIDYSLLPDPVARRWEFK